MRKGWTKSGVESFAHRGSFRTQPHRRLCILESRLDVSQMRVDGGAVVKVNVVVWVDVDSLRKVSKGDVKLLRVEGLHPGGVRPCFLFRSVRSVVLSVSFCLPLNGFRVSLSRTTDDGSTLIVKRGQRK